MRQVFLISEKAQLTRVNELVNSGATYTDAEGATKNYHEAAYKLTADIDYGRVLAAVLLNLLMVHTSERKLRTSRR